MLKPPRVLIVSLFTAIVLIPVWPARAWIDAGHKIVAMMAWEELTPTARAGVVATLKAHPRFEKDLVRELPPTTEPTTQTVITDDFLEPLPGATDRHVFANAAVWPDLVRLQSHPMRATYNHPLWHYITIPIVVDNQPLPAEPKPKDPPPHNIVDALSKCVADLKDPAVSQADKAVALCWIEHLVGDIHQPLHSGGRVSPQYPKGDEGGNLIVLLRDPPYADSSTKLHLIWDSLPGQGKGDDVNRYQAEGIRSDPRFSREKMKEALTVTDFMAWANESHALAVRYVYLDGKLKGATTREARDSQREYLEREAQRDTRRDARREGQRAGTTQPAAAVDDAQPEILRPIGGQPQARTGPREYTSRVPGVPPGYIARAESVAIRQVALAGHRLADFLNAVYAEK